MNNRKDERDPQESLTPLPELLGFYRAVLVWLFVWTLLVAVVVAGVLVAMDILDNTEEVEFRVPILGLVVMAGSLGALFSSLTRLYTLHELPAAVLWQSSDKTKHGFIVVFCLVPIVVGIVGSAFFYVFMQAGIVNTPIFVDFSCNVPDHKRAFDGLFAYSPCGPSEYAKAIVWGFVSGFSERLIPDTLARMEKSQAEK